MYYRNGIDLCKTGKETKDSIWKGKQVMKRVVIWGAGGTGENILSQVQEKYKVLCFVDEDSRKWGTYIKGYDICEPAKAIASMEYDFIIIASSPGLDFITDRLLSMGIPEEKIISTYVLWPLESRRQFVKNLAAVFEEENMEGACAEAGVFEGDFAKYINMYFPERKLYLFDTFEGFCECDILIEEKLSVSKAQTSDYSYTSVEMVKSKMPYLNQVEIIKGYFPESALNISQKFCFVNLDLDLYQPTLKGLKWLKDKIVHGGVILVHDYYSEIFKGPRMAVDEFVKDNSGLKKLPIGDGISIMLYGF